MEGCKFIVDLWNSTMAGAGTGIRDAWTVRVETGEYLSYVHDNAARYSYSHCTLHSTRVDSIEYYSVPVL